MSGLTLNPENFGLRIYNRFPPVYREDDVRTDYSLKRYLEICADGGFKYSIEEINGLLDLANPDQATPQALPILFQQYGLDIFHGIPEMYLRYLLPRLGEAWAKKGSLDVIDFVASAVAGVQTSTEVKYDKDNNVTVDLRLDMDYSLGNYFPSTKQLYRLLEKFLPFYLDMTLIYVYVFYEDSSLHGEDPRFDLVTHTTNEKGLFYSSGLRPIPMTPDHRLNVDFILNQCERVAPDPDTFSDSICTPYNEGGSLFHRFTPLDPRVPMLNTDRLLNHNFIIHGGKLYLPERCYLVGSLNTLDFKLNDLFNTSPPLYTEVDCHFDEVITVPMIDNIQEDAKDERKDCVVIKPSFYHTLNTGLTLNSGFVTNKSNIEEGHPSMVESDELSIHNTTEEDATFIISPLGILTNTLGLVLNRAVLKVPDEIDLVQYSDGSRQTVFL